MFFILTSINLILLISGIISLTKGNILIGIILLILFIIFLLLQITTYINKSNNRSCASGSIPTKGFDCVDLIDCGDGLDCVGDIGDCNCGDIDYGDTDCGDIDCD